MNQPPIRIADEVRDALATGAPVVAIESTVIAHGLPAPANRIVADAMAGAVRDGGAVPAMIGVIDGEIVVGLNEAEITRLADDGDRTMKLSRRDLPYAVALGRDGGTTVSATMICADLAGIRVMATGGIGGVHRGAESTMDVSADLEELGRTNVAVVCSSAKAVLDLPRTLEYLETRGVPVIGFGTDALPYPRARTPRRRSRG
jgi:pseudouridylate synthase